MGDLGRQVKYGLGIGADVGASAWINHLSFELLPKTEYKDNESAYGVLERTNSSVVQRQWAEGNFEAKLTADGGGYALLGAFGTVVTSDNVDTNPVVKDHTFTINQNTAGQQFTFIRKDSLTTEKYTAGRFGEWELSMELDDYVKFTSKIYAKAGATTTATPAYTSQTEFVAKHMNVKTATTEAGLGAASNITALESFTLRVNPNIEPDWQAGNVAPYSFTGRGYEIGFEMTKRYNDTVYELAYKNGTQLALQITAANTDVLIGATSNPKLVITAPKMLVTDWTRSEDLDSPLTETLTGTIHYSVADARAIRAVLTNTFAAYA